MLRENLGVGVDVNGYTLRLSVQIKGELIFGRGKVDHEERLDGDFGLSSRPECQDKED